MKLVISNSGHAAKPFLDRIHLMQGDITKQEVDAIVILIPQTLEYRGSINESVQTASGQNMDEFILDNIYKPKVGEVYALPAFNLPAKHILVGVLPKFRTDFDMNPSHLSSVVRRVMELARCMLLTSIAFPPLASGRHGYPKAKAARLVCQGVLDRLEESFEDIRIVCSDEQMLETYDGKLRVLGWDGG